MRTATVKIKSKAPLLMNRRPLEEETTVKKKGQPFDPKEDAEKKSYFDDKLGYYIPSDMIEGVLREAGKNIKNGRASYKKAVMCSVFCSQEKIPLNRKDYDEIDKRFGTHPSTGNGVLVARVRFDEWTLSFDLNFDDTRVDDAVLRALLEEAGAVVGIGSYKPKFGRFEVLEFKVQKAA